MAWLQVRIQGGGFPPEGGSAWSPQPGSTLAEEGPDLPRCRTFQLLKYRRMSVLKTEGWPWSGRQFDVSHNGFGFARSESNYLTRAPDLLHLGQTQGRWAGADVLSMQGAGRTPTPRGRKIHATCLQSWREDVIVSTWPWREDMSA